MATPAEIETARRDLGGQLAARRKAAGLKQWQLAQRIGCARSTVAMAETGHRCSPGFWRAADDALSAGGVFTAAAAQIVAAAAARRLPPLREGPGGGPVQTITSLARCPACGDAIAVVAQVVLSVQPVNVSAIVTGSRHQPDR